MLKKIKKQLIIAWRWLENLPIFNKLSKKRIDTNSYIQGSYLLLARGSKKLQKKLPSVIKATEDGTGIDILCHLESAHFIRNWLRYADEKDLQYINKAIDLHFSIRELSPHQVIVLEFFIHNPPESGKKMRDCRYWGGEIVHANVALCADDNNWAILGVPVLISFDQREYLPSNAVEQKVA